MYAHCDVDVRSKPRDRRQPVAPQRTCLDEGLLGRARQLAPGEFLYQDGEVRDAAFKIECGAVCHYIRWDDGRHDVIEFAFPGEIVGLGHLAEHVSTAQAMVDTIVTPVSREELDQALAVDAKLAMRLAAAGDREFDILRQRSAGARPAAPLSRVAALLLALAHAEPSHASAPPFIAGDVAGTWAADAINMSVETLTGALATLEEEGLIARTEPGFEVRDPAALERLADAG